MLPAKLLSFHGYLDRFRARPRYIGLLQPIIFLKASAALPG